MRSPRLRPRAFLISILIIEDWVKLTCQVYSLLFEGVRWFWGLTCDFWAEIAEKNVKAKTRAIKSVASPFGLHSGLRQSGGRFHRERPRWMALVLFRLGEDRGRSLRDDNKKGRRKGKCKSKSKSEMRGLLRFAARKCASSFDRNDAFKGLGKNC
jgi:hypothetical protein